MASNAKCQSTYGVIVSALLCLAVFVGSPRWVDASVYNLRLLTDNAPDYTDIESFVDSITGHLQDPQDKCIAVWRWGRRSRRQTSNATEDGRLIWDPILHYNSYGTMNCGVISGLNIACWLQLGYQGRYIQLGDHTVSEVSWDRGQSWHLFDSSMSFFCYNDVGAVASCQEIKSAGAGEFSNGRSEPGYYYYYHGAPQCITHRGKDGWRSCSDNPVAYDRTLANGASSYTDGFSIDKYTLHARYGRRYILNLAPGQTYTRYWRALGSSDSNLAGGEDDRDYYRPLKDKDPDTQHNLHNIRGNGVWVYRPDLRSNECRRALFDYGGIEMSGNRTSAPAIHPAVRRRPAFVVFKISAANVITSMRIKAEIRRNDPNDLLRMSVSRHAGIDWKTVRQSNAIGSHVIDLSLRDEVAGATECLVKIEMLAAQDPTKLGIDTVELKTITQLNRRTLPKLTLGSNRVSLAAGRQVDTTVFWPVLHDDMYKRTVYEARNICTDKKPDGMYKATLGAGVNGADCEAVWRVETPTDMLTATLGAVVTNRSPAHSVALSYSFNGEDFSEFYRKSDGSSPFDKQVLHSLNAEGASGTRQVYFKTSFFCRSGAATYGMPGVQDVLMQVEHRARDAGFRPIEVTYNWTEHRETGDVTRSHTELIESLPHDYAINVGGFRDPTMNWVRMNLQSDDAADHPMVYGYSDGQDVGTGAEPEMLVYSWGANIARGKAYTASRPSSVASHNPDTGSELTNGKIIAATDYITSKNVQAATAMWSAGNPLAVTVDLEREQRIEGVRVSTHQPTEEYCHPERIEVAVSANGETWLPGGIIEHNHLWKPPGDYELWEHDDSPRYADLPAGGRLAYSYPLAFARSLRGRYVQLIFTPLEGRGMGLSEIEVFAEVETGKTAPLVSHREPDRLGQAR
jgi:hypothetical protein